jgi:hypothetical protein
MILLNPDMQMIEKERVMAKNACLNIVRLFPEISTNCSRNLKMQTC